MSALPGHVRADMAEIFSSMVRAPIALAANAGILAILSYPIVLLVGFPDLYTLPIIDSSQTLAYAFASVMGFSLYIASLNVREDNSGSSGGSQDSQDDEGSEIDTLSEAPRLIFEVLAAITMILLFPVSGVVLGVLASTYVSPVLGIVVAVWYPAFDLWLYSKIGRPVTPVTLALIPLYALVAVWTGMILAFTLLLGLAIGTPLAGIEGIADALPDDGDLSLGGLELRRPPTR